MRTVNLVSTRHKLLLLIAAAVSTLGSVLLVEYLQRDIQLKLKQEYLSSLAQQLALVRSNIESELNANIFLVDSLATIISVNPLGNEQDWQPLTTAIMQKASSIRNIAIAPDNIVQFVYPLTGNEAIVGFDYRTSAEQFRTIEMAKNSKSVFIAGPLTLVQGGTAVIARVPVFSHLQQDYWGTCSVVIDMDKLFATAGLNSLYQQAKVAIRGKDATGAAGAVFFGEESTFFQAFAQENIRLLSGSWQIAIAEDPEIQLHDNKLLVLTVRVIGYGLCLALFVLITSLFYAYRLARLASLQDHLTLLPNRRFATQLLETLLKNQVPFTILSLDLDKFKQVNDRFGHATGDALLCDVAVRLKTALRSTDFACRISGDEFLLILPRLNNLAAVQQIIDNISRKLRQSAFQYEGHSMDILFSLGYAIYPQHANTLKDLLHYADLAMYQQKQQHNRE